MRKKKDCANFERLGSWVAVAGGAKGDARWVRNETGTRSSDGQLLHVICARIFYKQTGYMTFPVNSMFRFQSKRKNLGTFLL
jgi:hypothetical protein